MAYYSSAIIKKGIPAGQIRSYLLSLAQLGGHFFRAPLENDYLSPTERAQASRNGKSLRLWNKFYF